MLEGPLAALDAMEQATGESEATVIGYCLGGTLLAATLAYLAAKSDRRIKAATFFASLVDFERPGRARRLHRRGAARRDGRDDGQARLSRRPPTWRPPSTCCAPTT